MTPALEVRALRRSFGGLAVADNITLSLNAGERTALIGPNGAGKTTLVNLISGTLPPQSGAVLLAGEDVSRLGPAGRVRRGLVRSFQVTRLFEEMSPVEHVALAILQREGRAGRMIGNHRAMPGVMAETNKLLERLGLADEAQLPVQGIAYGQQRLVELAIALALKPKVLLLDEPAAGVPQGETGRIEAALASLPRDLAVMMIDHDMDLVFRFARRIVVMAAGAIIFDGAPADAMRDSRVRAAYLGSYADVGSIA